MAEPFLAELRIMSFVFPPRGWALANGQLLPINQNQALFSLLGTMYGGDGRVNFALPNLRGRVPIHMGAGFTLGQVGGEESHTLSLSELPQHSHSLGANTNVAALSNVAQPTGSTVLGNSVAKPNQGATSSFFPYSSTLTNPVTLNSGVLASIGNGDSHENRQPYQTLSVCIALQGIFPSEN